MAWLFAAAAASAQAPPVEAAPAPSAAPGAGDAQKPADGPKAAEGQKPDAAVPQGFTYNPEGRRDPFVSMLRRGTAQTGPRVSGLAGLETAEVSLRGTVRSDGTYVGILQGVDAKNYIARAGDKLRDGTIQTISADSMVILQQVNDPLSLVKQREVRKLLRQMEEAK
jgi:Tfp pilus assembly protein PilP